MEKDWSPPQTRVFTARLTTVRPGGWIPAHPTLYRSHRRVTAPSSWRLITRLFTLGRRPTRLGRRALAPRPGRQLPLHWTAPSLWRLSNPAGFTTRATSG